MKSISDLPKMMINRKTGVAVDAEDSEEMSSEDMHLEAPPMKMWTSSRVKAIAF